MHPLLLAARTGWFAEGRFLGRILDEWINDTQEFIRTKLPHLVVVAIIAFVLNYLLKMTTDRMIRIAERHAAGRSRISQVKTLAGVIRTTGLAIIGAIVGMQFLAAVGVNLAPLLASAGVAGVAIGLAAQNIVKDVLNGILILIEDQFDVGDTVKLAGLAGTVEGMTLRKTMVRDADGTLYVIPNSQITTVANQSIGYSVATVNVSVDFSANPDDVLNLLKTIAMEIRNSDEFGKIFVADPQVLGVDAFKGSELVFPVVFKTLATQQYGPVREFRRRVRLALEEHQMLPGDPLRVFQSFGEQADVVKRGEQADVVKRPPAEEPAPAQDPTTIKPQETNPFSGE
jgi:moderate conductance mechanosensitive channel